MANAEHENLLRDGVKCWNDWRNTHLEILPDLSEADFQNLYLTGINLSNVNLRGAAFRNCVLMSANFESAKLQGATFSGIKSAEKVNFLYAENER
jgi:uncharacterized protein YjbI with pentapeptide repeats